MDQTSCSEGNRLSVCQWGDTSNLPKVPIAWCLVISRSGLRALPEVRCLPSITPVLWIHIGWYTFRRRNPYQLLRCWVTFYRAVYYSKIRRREKLWMKTHIRLWSAFCVWKAAVLFKRNESYTISLFYSHLSDFHENDSQLTEFGIATRTVLATSH